MTAASEPLRLRACLRSTPQGVWALAVLFAALMGLYSVAVPIYHGPDETKHVDMLFAVTEPGGWPAAYSRTMNEQVVESSRAVGYAPGRPARSAEEAVPRSERASFAELAADEPSAIDNQMWQHPPLAYVVTGTVLTVMTAVAPPLAGWASDQVVGLARLLGALALVPLPLLAFWATRRLAGRDSPAPMIAAVVAVAVPGVAHIGASVTNDGLLIALLGLLTVPLVYVATGDVSTRTAVTAGVVAGLALLAKGFALFAPAWMALAYAVAAWRGGRIRFVRAGRSGVVALAVTAVVGGWWWLRNLLLLGVIQPAGSNLPDASEGFRARVGDWLAVLWNLTPRTFWGHFGWIEAQLPWPVIWSAMGVLAAAIAGGFAARRRRDPWTRVDLVLVLAPLAGAGAIMVYGSWSLYVASAQIVALHGRYLMGAMVGLACAAGLGMAALSGHRVGRWLAATTLMAAAAVHISGFLALLERYWMVEGAGYGDGLSALLAWSPWPPAIVAGGAVVAAAALGWAVGDLLVNGGPRPVTRRPPTAHGGDDASSTRCQPRAPAPPSG